ncbi:GIY-YIG nuclease family protein [Romboutsia sp. 1001713B170207_170306_H8]|uniref:GIY-YIG nuclease family protein n=1 Tax=Romboutsia sp. 1001713B170207_170306_H8 TaxID=2787112 RepID=UPI001899E6CB|nr:GIY-YIG nuclease family protein [Romboutsia sp. 1001713B170207_170306_H8]
MKNCVYRFIGRDHNLIYIGKAKNLEKRLSNHNHLEDECYKELAYIEYTSFDSEHEMDFAERYYIQKLNPKYNMVLSDKPISFNCEELDKRCFKIYEVNQYVVEHTLEQIELLKKEDLCAETNVSIIELAGILTIVKCDSYLNIKTGYKDKLKSYDEMKKCSYAFSENFVKKINELKEKYHLLDIVLAYKDIHNIGKYLDVKKEEFLLNLKYKEKYKEEWKILEFILKCK